MSAYIVPKTHIDYLILAALSRVLNPGHSGPLGYYRAGEGGRRERAYITNETADETGRILWAENVRSVAHRYPNDADGHRPGPVGMTEADAATYRLTRATAFIDPLQVLVAVAGLEYQSCEHPGWPDSEAKAILDAIHKSAIRALPGYDNAKWCVDEMPTRPVSLEVPTW